MVIDPNPLVSLGVMDFELDFQLMPIAVSRQDVPSAFIPTLSDADPVEKFDLFVLVSILAGKELHTLGGVQFQQRCAEVAPFVIEIEFDMKRNNPLHYFGKNDDQVFRSLVVVRELSTGGTTKRRSGGDLQIIAGVHLLLPFRKIFGFKIKVEDFPENRFRRRLFLGQSRD